MVYKLITKVIANRIKPLLPSIVFDTQGAFTQGRLISDNILMAYEVFHAMRSDTNLNGSMAVKLDMAKAFDSGVDFLISGHAAARLQRG